MRVGHLHADLLTKGNHHVDLARIRREQRRQTGRVETLRRPHELDVVHDPLTEARLQLVHLLERDAAVVLEAGLQPGRLRVVLLAPQDGMREWKFGDQGLRRPRLKDAGVTRGHVSGRVEGRHVQDAQRRALLRREEPPYRLEHARDRRLVHRDEPFANACVLAQRPSELDTCVEAVERCVPALPLVRRH